MIPTGDDFSWVDISDVFDFQAPKDLSEHDTTSLYPYRSHGAIFYDFDGDNDIDVYIGNGGASNLDIYADYDDLTMFSQREPNRLLMNQSTGTNGWIDLIIG